MLTHTLGFPRIGLNRELKRAQESFWQGKTGEEELLAVGKELRARHWKLQQDAGVDLIPVGDFAFYDQVLNTTVLLDAIPERFRKDASESPLKTYFRMARGEANVPAMEMSKWFDTNYHYLVPEFSPNQTFKLGSTSIFDQVAEAKAAGIQAKPVLVGPFTYVKLGKSVVEGFDRFSHLDAIVAVYEEVLQKLGQEVEWIQIDEPALVLDLSAEEQAVFKRVYERLSKAAGNAKLILATYFDALLENTELAFGSGATAVHVDLVRAPKQLEAALKAVQPGQLLSLGVVNGRNIWRVDADAALKQIEQAKAALGADRLLIASSCSLQHVPVDLDGETQLDAEIKSWLAFAKQKCQELRLLADVASGKGEADQLLAENRAAWKSRRSSTRVTDPTVRQRLQSVTKDMADRQSPHAQRKVKQQAHLNLPVLPTTTIGSFPQTLEVRKARRQFKNGEIDQAAYTQIMQDYIRDSVERQHELGIDVLVHGEPERNDMVEYFGEQLSGFCFTQNGWVQSYGSRCVKPPVIYGDVSRPEPMTIEWIKYAQSLTQKPMKGMLTGPVTILCWSFVRDDQTREETCRQIALAIRDEVVDLEKNGISIIQVDEAALREGLPLRRADWEEYLSWAVESFRLTAAGVQDETQLHTHMCYSEFNDILPWIAQMDADVISIEASRSKMELLLAFRKFEYPNDIGPGIYDIHSPRVPSLDEMSSLLSQALEVIPAERIWVNPDCGLKTRGWTETLESLRSMVKSAQDQRATLQA